MLIEFENPTEVIQGKERRSKLLKTSSPLYSLVSSYRDKLVRLFPNGVGDKRMDFHIELINGNEKDSPELLLERTKKLEKVDIQNFNVTIMNEKAVVLECPMVEGYGNTHITIAYFPKKVNITETKLQEYLRN